MKPVIIINSLDMKIKLISITGLVIYNQNHLSVLKIEKNPCFLEDLELDFCGRARKSELFD